MIPEAVMILILCQAIYHLHFVLEDDDVLLSLATNHTNNKAKMMTIPTDEMRTAWNHFLWLSVDSVDFESKIQPRQ